MSASCWVTEVCPYEHLDAPSPHTPGGMKGMAEGDTIAPPPTIASAVADALGGAAIPRDAVSFDPRGSSPC